MSEKVDRYYNEKGELGVLISPGFGTGWSTEDCPEWSTEKCPELAYDKRIVDKWFDNPTRDEMEEFLESIGYKNVNMRGYKNLSLVWIPSGIMFCITSYDGDESIRTAEDLYMMIA